MADLGLYSWPVGAQRGIVARSAAIEGAATEGDLSHAQDADAAIEHLIVISGLSGAGKSQASKLFEDLGYSCVDNLPPALLEDYLALRRAEPDRFRRSALVLDIRAGDPAPAIERAAAALAAEGTKLELIFLEASDASLVSRFSETRHRHPLEATRLFAVMPRASVSEELRIDIVTFGFKYGIPLEADLVFDVRFLTNPYWDPHLKPLSGLEEPVREFVLNQPSARRFLELVTELLELTVPAYRAEGKEQLRVALGCTGGYHRSIALAEELRSRLAEISGATVTVFHRELER